MPPRKKKSDLATVTMKLSGKKVTPNVLDAAFTKIDQPASVSPPAPIVPDLPILGEPDELFNVRAGTVATVQPDGTLGAPQVIGKLATGLAEQAQMAVDSLTPTERAVLAERFKNEPAAAQIVQSAGAAPSKYKPFNHIQANVKGGVDVRLAPCTAIVGPNRSKKTAVLDAIKLAILGKHPSVADRPTDLLAFASTGATNLTATITSPNGTLTTMMADAPGFKRPTHEAAGELNELLAAVNVEAFVPTVAVGELLSFGETRLREAVFKRFGGGIEVKMPDGLSEDQQELWLSTEKLLRGGENGEAVEPTYALLAEKFRQLKLEAGRQLKRSEESAAKARAELGDAVLVPKDQVEHLHLDLEKLTKESAGFAQAMQLNSAYQADKASFIRAFETLGDLPPEPGAEPAFGVQPAGGIDLAPLRKAKDEAGVLVSCDEVLLKGLELIVVAAEKSGVCPCCRTAGMEAVGRIRATHAIITKRYEQRTQAANDALIALTNAARQNEQNAQRAVESIEHATWRVQRDTRLAAEQRRAALVKQKEVLIARKAALPPEPSLQQQADIDQAIDHVRVQLKTITMQAGQVAVLESHETEARRARNHNGVFKVLEVEAKTALQRSLEKVRTAALECVNRYVPAGWEIRLTLDDGACRWEIVGADGMAHGKGVASGSEWVTLTIALACAWTEGSPLRVLLVDDDDLGKLSPESLKAFLDRVREVVEGGWLTQAVVAWTRAEEIPAGWTKVQR